MIASVVALMMTQASAGMEVGYEALVAGDQRVAIAQIDSNNTLPSDDPALLINKGIALAREGQFDEARDCFEAALSSEERYELETVQGEWIDSRQLAREALAMLDRGEFARYYALSMR